MENSAYNSHVGRLHCQLCSHRDANVTACALSLHKQHYCTSMLCVYPGTIAAASQLLDVWVDVMQDVLQLSQQGKIHATVDGHASVKLCICALEIWWM